MEVIEHTIEYTRPETFHFYPFNDLHDGSVDAAEEDSTRKINECLHRKNAYATGIGDYNDCIHHNDPRFDGMGLAPWVEKTNIVESQRVHTREKFMPLAKAGKLLAWGTGNHEEEIHMRHDNDIARNVAKDLKVPYGGYAYFLVLTFKRKNSSESHRWTIHCWHGAGAAQTEGARVMRLMRLVNDIEADIYLMGHLHTITTYSPDRLVCRSGRIKSVQLHAAITGSWLKTYAQPHKDQILNPSYGEKKGYKPSRIGAPVIHITPDSGECSIEG